ncbi:MAG: ferrous iron transport protein A [Treponema sp.]|jgi:Fe2+ transport system protein FeoA|nr:ferrous iron transport protein A [Treponema sp.]
MKLSELKPGESGIIINVGGTGALRRHLLDIGLTPKTSVFVRKVAPIGDPIELCLRGYELTLRLSEAEQIEIEKTSNGYDFSICKGNCNCCNNHRKRRRFRLWGKHTLCDSQNSFKN